MRALLRIPRESDSDMSAIGAEDSKAMTGLTARPANIERLLRLEYSFPPPNGPR